MTDEVHWTRPDAPEVAGMMAELLHEYVSRYGQAARERMERFPDSTLTPPDGGLMVLLRNGTAVAGGAFRRYDEQTAELKRIWTHSSYRRQGLARRVLDVLRDETSRLGYRRLYLTTGPRQPEARALYLAAGFTPLFDVTVPPAGPLPFEKALLVRT
ncbi:GNAT family N-acetyltransferase [Lentzea sp. NBC_00516]|uniref:GNAT family N-acetyltransferase n=1 Tax=Lentzea sp. NBC_00516 TaxID=2903582 RepID=UPI002E8196FC|nr:GNAT family N-acetyltransferase [Lentzea sp. NBC_00516]WUD28111.1 GNAT family N-acetyltransferase [Lentzea sp. NBC_00516]